MNYDIKAIGNRAYNARNIKNLKQKYVSNHIGVDQSTYSRFENGMRDLSLPVLFKLCELLEVDLVWLLGLKDSDLTDSEQIELENYKQYIISKRK